MARKLLIILMLINSAGAFATDSQRERPQAARDISSISELLPGLDTLDCTPRCTGAPICGEFREMNSCLDQGAAADCFWSCE
jgi:hypothetical protein